MAELDISKIVEDISIKAQEKEESFIFETVRPFCNNVLMEYKMEITKEDLKRALLLHKEYDKLLKADKVAMLEEIDLQFDKICFYKNMGEWKTVPEIKAEYKAVIQQKINALKGSTDGKKDS